MSERGPKKEYYNTNKARELLESVITQEEYEALKQEILDRIKTDKDSEDMYNDFTFMTWDVLVLKVASIVKAHPTYEPFQVVDALCNYLKRHWDLEPLEMKLRKKNQERSVIH